MYTKSLASEEQIDMKGEIDMALGSKFPLTSLLPFNHPCTVTKNNQKVVAMISSILISGEDISTLYFFLPTQPAHHNHSFISFLLAMDAFQKGNPVEILFKIPQNPGTHTSSREFPIAQYVHVSKSFLLVHLTVVSHRLFMMSVFQKRKSGRIDRCFFVRIWHP